MTIPNTMISALRIRRMLVEMGAEKRRRNRRVPTQQFPTGAKLRYKRQIMLIQKTLEQAVRDNIFRNLKELSVQSKIERPDSGSVRIDNSVADTIEKMVGDVRVTVAQYLDPIELDIIAGTAAQDVATFNKKEMNRLIQSTVGIDAITAEPWMASQMQAFRKENVNLIKSITEDQLSKVENVLMRGQRRGLRVEVLREQIEKQFKVSRNRASLIARDQTNKLNAELSQLRQQSLGVKEYIWRTSGDSDVRETHQPLDGTRHRWDDPPVTNDAGDRNHPGEDYQCRCWAEPVIEELLLAAGQ